MAFTIHGTYRGTGRRGSITWDDGVIGGDALAVAELTAVATALDGFLVGPPEGPTTLTDHLSSAFSTLILVEEHVFPYDATTEGDVPRRTGREDQV